MHRYAGAPACSFAAAGSPDAADGSARLGSCACADGPGCALGTYNPLAAQGSVASCLQCPSGSSTAQTGASDITQCTCVSGTVGTIVDVDSNCTRMHARAVPPPARAWTLDQHCTLPRVARRPSPAQCAQASATSTPSAPAAAPAEAASLATSATARPATALVRLRWPPAPTSRRPRTLTQGPWPVWSPVRLDGTAVGTTKLATVISALPTTTCPGVPSVSDGTCSPCADLGLGLVLTGSTASTCVSAAQSPCCNLPVFFLDYTGTTSTKYAFLEFVVVSNVCCAPPPARGGSVRCTD